MICDRCQGKKVILKKEGIAQCICARKEYIAFSLAKVIADPVKYKNPKDLMGLGSTEFIEGRLNVLKDFIAGFLLLKSTLSIKCMTISSLFQSHMEEKNYDRSPLLNPDFMLVHFPCLFLNKAAPIFLIQLCEERRQLNKHTWIVSDVPLSDLEAGFRENKDVFYMFIKTIGYKKFNTKSKIANKSMHKVKSTDNTQSVYSWEGTV